MTDRENRKEYEKARKRRSLKIFCIVLAVILALIVAVAIWLDAAIFSRLRRPDDSTLSQDEIDEIMGDPEDTLSFDPADVIKPDGDVINVLLVGQDRREGEPRSHSDAMIFCTVNKKTKTITMTSFMRDIWVKIPGYGDQRINTPYMIDGFKLLNKTLEYNFGVSTEYTAEIDFGGFMKAVDMMGGIDLELTAEEAAYLNRRGLWDVQPNVDWTLHEGENHMDGMQTLAYSRIRAIGDDFGRTERQRTVLTKLIGKAKEMSLPKLYALVYEMIPTITTDMTNGQIMGLAMDIAPMLGDMQIVSQRIPVGGQFSFETIDGMSVIALSQSQMQAARDLLAQTMQTEPAETKETE